jgi:hypothetical protein
MLLLGAFCLAIWLAVTIPDTRTGRLLRGALIEAPVQYLAKLSFAKLVVNTLLLAIIIGVLVAAFSTSDGVVLLMMLPEALAWMAAFDLLTLMELSFAVWLVAASARLSTITQIVRASLSRAASALLRRFSRRAARARRRATRKPLRPAADDDGAPWAVAWA